MSVWYHNHISVYLAHTLVTAKHGGYLSTTATLPISPQPIASGCCAPTLTLGADAAEVGDLHQHAREHVGLVGPSAPGVDLQGLQERLLQPVHALRLLQVHAV